jgi:hypothetical protein
MKTNFKIDYRQLTAAHFTTFPQTEQSAAIISRNNRSLVTAADNLGRDIARRATDKVRQQFIGGKINLQA